MKKIALIGARGFIGQNLLEHLKNYDVISVTRNDLDLKNLSSVVDLFKTHHPEIIINLAAYKKRGSSYDDFVEAISTNLIGTLNIAEAAKRCGFVKHLLFLGSAEEYGSGVSPFDENQAEAPISAYSSSKTFSKVLLDTLFRLENLPFTYLRPSLVYGPGQGEEMFVSSLVKTLKKNMKFSMTAGEQLRDFIHVDDLSSAIIKIVEAGEITHGKVYNVGSGQGITIKDVAILVAKKLKAEELLEIGTIPYRNAEIFDYRCSIKKIENELGWKAKIKIEDGLDDLIKKL